MDLRFWLRVCTIVLFLFSAILLGIAIEALRLNHMSEDDVSASMQIVASLFNNSNSPNQIYIPFDKWNKLNLQLYAVSNRWSTLVSTSIAGITIICFCLVFEIILFLLPYRARKPIASEKSALIVNAANTQRSFRESAQTPSQSTLPTTDGAKKSTAMMCEGALYEPWNQATLDKLSGEEAPPAAKITRAIYRYGPIAGKILLRRFGHLLSDHEISEIERILNFGQEKG